jgi:hypothetical protein
VLIDFFQKLFDHHFGRSEFIPAMYQCDFVGIFCQMQRFIESCIAATDRNNALTFKKRRITGSTIADAGAGTAEFLFAGDAELSVTTSGSENNGPCDILLGIAKDSDTAIAAFLKFCDLGAGFYFRAETLDLLFHFLNQTLAVNLLNAGVVFDFVGGTDLAAG